LRRFIALAVTLVLSWTALAAFAAAPEVVLDEPDAFENVPSASDGYLVWSSFGPAGANSYVMGDGGEPVRVNPARTQSLSASIDDATVVYDVASGKESLDLTFFDAVAETRSAPPAGVNTPNDEYRPSLSGDWLLFTRSNVNRVPRREAWRKVVLFNLSTSARFVLDEKRYRRVYLVSDQVNGDWATFESCLYPDGIYRDCEVFRYQISAQELVTLPNPGLQQYAAGVSSDGTVYFFRSRNRDHWVCGDHARALRYPVGGPISEIGTLQDGRDAIQAFAFDEPGGSTTLYFDRRRCSPVSSGIYRITDADTV
jgi:hypothetical protein